MMAWALMSGLTYIFFDGSYVVFAQWLTDEKRSVFVSKALDN